MAADLSNDPHVTATYSTGNDYVTIKLDDGFNHKTGSLDFTVTYENGQDTTYDVSLSDASSSHHAYFAVDSTADAASHHIVTGTTDDDTINKSSVTDDLIIQGGAGDDTIYAGDGNDTIYGGDGNDIIYGGDGENIMFGGTGDDTLHAGIGNNIMTGGEGKDTFVFDVDSFESSGTTVIKDFHVSQGSSDVNADVLDIGDLLVGFNSNDTQDLYQGGFLTFDSITADGKGGYTVVVGIDRDGSLTSSTDGGHDSQALATIHIDGVQFTPGMSHDEMAQELMNQLVANQQIKFD